MELKKTLSELRIDADTAKKELNEAILSDSFTMVGTKKDAMDKAVKAYNDLAIVMDFATLRAKIEPMKSAIEQLSIAIIESKANKQKDSDIITYTLEPATKQIDLVAFDEFCQREKMDIAHDKMWAHMVDKMCLLVTYKIMKDVGSDTKKLEDTYYITDIAKQIDLGKTPTSNTQILKQLQSIVDAIIYETENDHNSYKVTTHDANYVVATMTKRGGSGKVVAPRPATMHTLIMDVLHRIITNSDYKVEYMTKKQAKDEVADSEKTKTVSSENKPISE
ncbi:MAG: hypothetical protein RR710_04200 [Oscillospiraceae bacterium]